MTTKDCGFAELTAGRALHALEPDDDRRLTEHLRTCALCRAELAAQERALIALAEGVEPEQPPARLRANVLAEIDATPQVPAAESELKSPSQHSPDEGSPGRAGTVTSLGAARRRSWVRPLLTAAAAVLVLAVVGLGVRVGQLSDERATQAQQAQRIADAVADPNAKLIALRTNDGQPAATLVAAKDTATLVPRSMSQNSDKTIFVAWGWSSGKPQALTTFDMHADQPVSLTWPRGASANTHFAVSLEQGRSAPAVPTDIVATSA